MASELTIDYRTNNEGGDGERCVAARCRGESSHSFFTLPDKIQHENYPLLAPRFFARYCGKLKQLQPGEVQPWLGVHGSEKVQQQTAGHYGVW